MKYQITATITKAGGLPTKWMRYSNKKLSKSECLKLVGGKRRGFNSAELEELKVELSNFECRRVEDGKRR